MANEIYYASIEVPFGAVRDIPLFWILIDMSFDAFGIIPLWFVRREIPELASQKDRAKHADL